MHNIPAEQTTPCTTATDNLAWRIKAVADFLGIGESTAWRWVSEGRLPQGIHLSPRVTVWRKADIVHFLEQVGGER